ncbi:hypothetical protein PS1_035667 [Malus domestica]
MVLAMNYFVSLVLQNLKARRLLCSVYLWNPSIRKLKRLTEGLIQPKSSLVALWFGFHGGANDHKVVSIQRLGKKLGVEVYSLIELLEKNYCSS